MEEFDRYKEVNEMTNYIIPISEMQEGIEPNLNKIICGDALQIR